MQVGNLGYPGRCERGSSRMIKLFLLTRNNAIMCASWRKVAVHCTSSKAVERRKDGCRIKQVQLDEEDVDVTTDDVICDVAWELCVDPAWIANSFTHSACPHPPSHTHTYMHAHSSTSVSLLNFDPGVPWCPDTGRLTKGCPVGLMKGRPKIGPKFN